MRSRLYSEVLFSVVLLVFVSSAVAFGGDGSLGFDAIVEPATSGMCSDDANNNNFDGVDIDDLGCVEPSTGNIDDSVADDIEGNIWDADLSQTFGGPKSKGILFSESVYRGSSTKTMDEQDSSSSTSITENYIDSARSEGNNWAYGSHETQTYTQSDFPGGAHFRDDRVIYPPNPIGSAACGDALENQDSQQSGVKGDTAGSDGTTFCTEDYGEIYEKYHVKSPYGTDPPGSPGCGCSDSGSETGPVYYASGDEVVEETEDCDSDGDCDCTPQPDGPPSCDTDYSEDTDTDPYDCDAQHSTVSAWRDSGSGVRNDPARTYTEFTAYDSSSEAWCGYEFTTTVDADGPRGEGDGLVAIEDRNGGSIAGTWAHDGTDNVGNRVWVDGSNMDARSKIDTSCPGQKEVCLKYVDFYTKDSGWTTASSGSGYKSAVSVDHEVFTADDSYSVCKMINKVASNDGTEERLVNCDYYRDGEPVSPLPYACGDDPRERLVAAEGTEVDEDVMKDYLAFQQECVQYETTGIPDVDANQYPSSGGDNNDEGFTNVQFAEIDKSSSVSSNGYQDFTASGKTELRKDQTYLLTVTVGQNGAGGWYEYNKAWIDWDQDEDFDESSEEYELGICAEDGCKLQTPVTVDENVGSGTTMMRVSMKYQGYPESDEDFIFGEVEDYSVKILQEERLTENACVMDGKIYPEGSVVKTQDSRSRFYDFENSGDSHDAEVCVGINDGTGDDILADDRGSSGSLNVENGDNGGEWWDLDNRKVTEYLRSNTVDSDEYMDYWQNNTDKEADPATGVKSYHKQRGLALEDDCATTKGKPSILEPYKDRSWDCEDSHDTVGRDAPYFAKFAEGSMDDDFNFGNTWLDINLANAHNRVQAGGNTGHDEDVISTTDRVVDTEAEWDEGVTMTDVRTDGGYLDSTEDRSDKDFNGALAGEDIYGLYVSKAYRKTPELRFSNLTINYEFSGGTHPLVVEYSDDTDFSSGDVDKETFWLDSSNMNKNFELGATENHKYMRFKIGIATAPTNPQVIFAVDESGSMGTIQSEVQDEIATFYDDLGSGSEGAVVGAVQGDVTPGNGFNTDSDDLEDAANNLEASGSGEWPERTVERAANYVDNSGSESYNWRAEDSRAIIWVQDGTAFQSCDGLDPGNNDVGDYLVDRNFKFYAATGYTPDCGSYYQDLADDTGGSTYDTGSNPDFEPILDDIQSDLNTIPTVSTVDKVTITSRTPPDPGPGSTQDDEPCWLATGPNSCEDVPNKEETFGKESLGELENAEIDPEDDEWALTPSLEWGIANNGTAWPPGQCHGSPRVQGEDKWKNQSVYANAYVRAQNDVWSVGYSDDDRAFNSGVDGNWINPDRDTLSVTSGGVTCDLTGHDWGYAVQSTSTSGIETHGGSEEDRTGDPSSPGTEGVVNILPVELTVEKSQFAWDMDSHHPRDPKTNLSQWKDACGDDRNEYLIREHAAKVGGEYNPTFNGRSNYYACADRPTDCVLDGEVYSEGMIQDVSSIAGQEYGHNSHDQEICLDINDELPGGEWWDVDNESIRKHIVDYDGEKSGSGTDPYLFVRSGGIKPFDPGEIFWHNGTREGANEVNRTPYNPVGVITQSYYTGYALEDDCDPDLTPANGCDDTGGLENLGNPSEPRRNSPGLIYSPFRESMGGNQVVFAVDETYSMGPVIEGVRNNIKWFYNGFNNAEGTVVGSGCDEDSTNYGDYHCLDGTYPGTSDLNALETGVDRLRERTSSEAPDDTIAEAVGFGTEASDYDGSSAVEYYKDENYDFSPNAAKAVIWVEDGAARGSCSSVSDSSEGELGDYLVDNNFLFYAIVRDLGGCRENFEAAAQLTGGKVYDLSSNPDSSDWQNILADIRSDLDGGRIQVRSEDHSTEDSWAVKMYVNGSHNDGRGLSESANTGQMYENTDGINFDSSDWGWPTSNLNDSKIDPNEDTWAVASQPYDAVGPTGAVYDVGSCYGESPPTYSEGWVLKNQTVMANSYVNRTEANVDGGDEGNWVDPDTTFKSVSNGSLSCDLNSTDWGIGYNTGTGTNLDTIVGDSREYGYNVADRHAVTGPISFDMGQKPLNENQDDLQQYPNACGDDQQEYLIREQRTYRGNEVQPNLTHRDNIYVCADRITDCAYNGYVFSEGQTADLSDFSPSHTDPEMGENISDEEICLDLNKTTPGGEWYDKDQNLTVKDRILGLEDTFTDDEEPGFGNCDYDISGKVVGAPGYGDVVIGGETVNLGSDNRFADTGIQMACGATKLIKYQRTGHVQAKKRVKLPNSGASLTDIVLSNSLMYQPTEVWDGIVKFQDHDFDRNPGTDWVRQGEKFEREEVSFFNRTHERFNETGSRILDSSYTASNWGSGEPNDKDGSENGEEDCAAVRSSEDWNDQTCTDLIKGICEFQDGSYATTAPRTWSVANQTCYSKGGHLAVVNSATENSMISSTYGHGWIGYRQDGSPSGPSDSWNWVNASGTYQPEAYATEDDCGPLLRKSDTAPCGDVGAGEQDGEWFSASNFSYGGVQP